MHTAERLWASQHPPAGYPRGVLPVPEPIQGLAFFPGGFGLWGAASGRPLPPFPDSGVMVLGHDFHSESGYRRSLELGAEPLTQPTWRNLLALLRGAGVSLEECFFTNFFVGLREGEGATGRFPGADSPDFVAHCERFFLEQVAAQRPRLLVTLGRFVPWFIAGTSEQLSAWRTGLGLKHVDAAGPVCNGVRFAAIPGFTTTAVALTHPSLRAAGVRHRLYRGSRGADAESLMLSDALAFASTGGDAREPAKIVALG